jgi:hypothetical protein
MAGSFLPVFPVILQLELPFESQTELASHGQRLRLRKGQFYIVTGTGQAPTTHSQRDRRCATGQLPADHPGRQTIA